MAAARGWDLHLANALVHPRACRQPVQLAGRELQHAALAILQRNLLLHSRDLLLRLLRAQLELLEELRRVLSSLLDTQKRRPRTFCNASFGIDMAAKFCVIWMASCETGLPITRQSGAFHVLSPTGKRRWQRARQGMTTSGAAPNYALPQTWN